METLSNDTVHASTSIAPNKAHIDVQNIDELSKEKEEELLYGTGEDGDEEEALSDDSLRLRLSDDENELEDITPVTMNTFPNKKQTKDMDEESKKDYIKNIKFNNETNTKIGNNTKNVNTAHKESILCHEQCPEVNLVKNVQINCSDGTSADKLKDLKNFNNLTPQNNENQLNIKSENGEIDINKQNDQSHDTRQELVLRSKEELLNHDCSITILDCEEENNSMLDKTIDDEDCKDGQEINCTKIITLDQCQKENENVIVTISKYTQSSVLTNEKNKTVQEDLLATNQKVNDIIIDKKTIDKIDDDVCQIQNHCLEKQTEKLNSVKVISENNDIHNTDQSVPQAINVDSDVNEIVASTDENSAVSKTTGQESTVETKIISNDTENKTVELSQKKRRRKRSKKLSFPEQDTIQENKQVTESGRQKRRTARNAEEIIRKKFLLQDSDVESNDSNDKLVVVNHKINQQAQPSPTSLKRICPDAEVVTINGNAKKPKKSSESVNEDNTVKEDNKNDIKNLNFVHKFFRRDLKEKLPKLKQEELEELLIQKIVETITMRGELGRLREQARISEKNQEATRIRCQQLTKQIKDFEMVLNRNAADRRANNDKPIPPIKINRSVGLQVNFITDHGIQSLRQLQQNSLLKSNANMLNNTSTSINPVINETNNNALSPRKGIKVMPPKRLEAPIVTQPVTVSQNSPQPLPLVPTVTPAALVVSKTIESPHSVNLQNQTNSVQQILPNQTQSLQPQAVVLNGKIPHQTNRQSAPHNLPKPKTSDLIDLTDEEEKSKCTSQNTPSITITAVTTNSITDQVNIISKAQPCFPRVIQTIPANVAITNQPASIRVVHTASHPTPTALVNNMNAPRLAYVMQSGVGSGRKLLITSSAGQIRPGTPCTRPPFTTLTYKTTGISTNANGTVRVLTTSAGPNVQLNKHPAPLPDTPHYAVNSASKLPPPAPSLKISKVTNGIVLSWNMTLSDKYADIVSYQLYAYQEVAGVPPNTNLWKKVGDVRALPLPMACTLTQFSEGNNYYFAVRAVDTHSRKGQYSAPGNISL